MWHFPPPEAFPPHCSFSSLLGKIYLPPTLTFCPINAEPLLTIVFLSLGRLMIKPKIIGTSFSKPNKCLLKKIPHCLQVPSKHKCEPQNKVFVLNIYYIMDRELGFHLFYGIFILVESFETRSANHCYYWPRMEISCLNRTLCSNGICSEPLVCLHRAAEGNKDKQWWEPDSPTISCEVAFPGKLCTSQSPGA